MQLKKWMVLSLLIGGVTLSDAALTKAQTKQVETSVNQMQVTLDKMMRLAVRTDAVLDDSNTFVTDFSTVSFSLSSQQQQDIVNYYQSLKTQLQTQFNTLP
jgi:hypothetical protein